MTTPVQQMGTEASQMADAVEELAQVIAGHMDRVDEDKRALRALTAVENILRPLAERLYAR